MFFDTPHLDISYKLIHIFGLPAIFGGLVWLVRTYDKAMRQNKEIAEGVKETQRMTMEVHGAVNLIQSNHLTHLSENMQKFSEVQEKTVEVLNSIDKGIGILVDRAPRV